MGRNRACWDLTAPLCFVHLPSCSALHTRPCHKQDLTMDNPITGKYWNTPNAIMTEKYAGAQDGNALVGNGVITGGCRAGWLGGATAGRLGRGQPLHWAARSGHVQQALRALVERGALC